MPIIPIDEQIRHLDEACDWLNVEKGRAAQYKTLLEQYRDETDESEDSFMACFESFDLCDIYLLWRGNAEQFTGLKEKLKKIFEQGPLLTDHEKVGDGGSVRSRNNAFAAVIAGRLLEAALDLVQVEGCRKKSVKAPSSADCTFQLKSKLFNVECKRLLSRINWFARVNAGKKQIQRSKKRGIVALDCSVLIRPKDTVYSSDNAIEATNEFSQWLEESIYPRACKILSANVFGLMLYARVPTLVETPKIGKDHFSPRVFSVISCLNVAYRGSTIGRRVMAAINKNLTHRGGVVQVREILSD